MKIIDILIALFILSLCSGCETTSYKPALYYYGGYKATMQAIDHHEGNREVAEFIVEATDLLLAKRIVAYSLIEEWYAREREKLHMDAIDRDALELIVIKPLWEKLKSKYQGLSLNLDDPEIKQSVLSFQAGMKAALRDHD